MACTTEAPTPIDFSSEGGTTTTQTDDQTSPHDGGLDDPNAAQRSQVFGFAEQQCLDDPDLETGIVQIATPDTGEVVNEVSVPCEEVRERAANGEPAGIEIMPEELRPDTDG